LGLSESLIFTWEPKDKNKMYTTFKDYIRCETVEEFDNMVDTNEALTAQQRMKMKATFRKNKAKIALGKKKAAKKLASPEKLKAKADKQARNILTKKILKGKDKAELSFAGRADLEKKLAKKKGAIAKISKKLLPQVRAADREKLKNNKGGDE
jgi:hypothetical protein